jgi:hypothetical protein
MSRELLEVAPAKAIPGDLVRTVHGLRTLALDPIPYEYVVKLVFREQPGEPDRPDFLFVPAEVDIIVRRICK